MTLNLEFGRQLLVLGCIPKISLLNFGDTYEEDLNIGLGRRPQIFCLLNSWESFGKEVKFGRWPQHISLNVSSYMLKIT